MASRTYPRCSERAVSNEQAAEFYDAPFDLDALAGDWFGNSSDPHYAELPCYVPLIDDDGLDPFGDDDAS